MSIPDLHHILPPRTLLMEEAAVPQRRAERERNQKSRVLAIRYVPFCPTWFLVTHGLDTHSMLGYSQRFRRTVKSRKKRNIYETKLKNASEQILISLLFSPWNASSPPLDAVSFARKGEPNMLKEMVNRLKHDEPSLSLCVAVEADHNEEASPIVPSEATAIVVDNEQQLVMPATAEACKSSGTEENPDDHAQAETGNGCCQNAPGEVRNSIFMRIPLFYEEVYHCRQQMHSRLRQRWVNLFCAAQCRPHIRKKNSQVQDRFQWKFKNLNHSCIGFPAHSRFNAEAPHAGRPSKISAYTHSELLWGLLHEVVQTSAAEKAVSDQLPSSLSLLFPPYYPFVRSFMSTASLHFTNVSIQGSLGTVIPVDSLRLTHAAAADEENDDKPSRNPSPNATHPQHVVKASDPLQSTTTAMKEEQNSGLHGEMVLRRPPPPPISFSFLLPPPFVSLHLIGEQVGITRNRPTMRPFHLRRPSPPPPAIIIPQLEGCSVHQDKDAVEDARGRIRERDKISEAEAGWRLRESGDEHPTQLFLLPQEPHPSECSQGHHHHHQKNDRISTEGEVSSPRAMEEAVEQRMLIRQKVAPLVSSLRLESATIAKQQWAKQWQHWEKTQAGMTGRKSEKNNNGECIMNASSPPGSFLSLLQQHKKNASVTATTDPQDHPNGTRDSVAGSTSPSYLFSSWWNHRCRAPLARQTSINHERMPREKVAQDDFEEKRSHQLPLMNRYSTFCWCSDSCRHAVSSCLARVMMEYKGKGGMQCIAGGSEGRKEEQEEDEYHPTSMANVGEAVWLCCPHLPFCFVPSREGEERGNPPSVVMQRCEKERNACDPSPQWTILQETGSLHWKWRRDYVEACHSRYEVDDTKSRSVTITSGTDHVIVEDERLELHGRASPRGIASPDAMGMLMSSSMATTLENGILHAVPPSSLFETADHEYFLLPPPPPPFRLLSCAVVLTSHPAPVAMKSFSPLLLLLSLPPSLHPADEDWMIRASSSSVPYSPCFFERKRGKHDMGEERLLQLEHCRQIRLQLLSMPFINGMDIGERCDSDDIIQKRIHTYFDKKGAPDSLQIMASDDGKQQRATDMVWFLSRLPLQALQRGYREQQKLVKGRPPQKEGNDDRRNTQLLSFNPEREKRKEPVDITTTTSLRVITAPFPAAASPTVPSRKRSRSSSSSPSSTKISAFNAEKRISFTPRASAFSTPSTLDTRSSSSLWLPSTFLERLVRIPSSSSSAAAASQEEKKERDGGEREDHLALWEQKQPEVLLGPVPLRDPQCTAEESHSGMHQRRQRRSQSNRDEEECPCQALSICARASIERSTQAQETNVTPPLEVGHHHRGILLHSAPLCFSSSTSTLLLNDIKSSSPSPVGPSEVTEKEREKGENKEALVSTGICLEQRYAVQTHARTPSISVHTVSPSLSPPSSLRHMVSYSPQRESQILTDKKKSSHPMINHGLPYCASLCIRRITEKPWRCSSQSFFQVSSFLSSLTPRSSLKAPEVLVLPCNEAAEADGFMDSTRGQPYSSPSRASNVDQAVLSINVAGYQSAPLEEELPHKDVQDLVVLSVEAAMVNTMELNHEDDDDDVAIKAEKMDDANHTKNHTGGSSKQVSCSRSPVRVTGGKTPTPSSSASVGKCSSRYLSHRFFPSISSSSSHYPMFSSATASSGFPLPLIAMPSTMDQGVEGNDMTIFPDADFLLSHFLLLSPPLHSCTKYAFGGLIERQDSSAASGSNQITGKERSTTCCHTSEACSFYQAASEWQRRLAARPSISSAHHQNRSNNDDTMFMDQMHCGAFFPSPTAWSGRRLTESSPLERRSCPLQQRQRPQRLMYSPHLTAQLGLVQALPPGKPADDHLEEENQEEVHCETDRALQKSYASSCNPHRPWMPAELLLPPPVLICTSLKQRRDTLRHMGMHALAREKASLEKLNTWALIAPLSSFTKGLDLSDQCSEGTPDPNNINNTNSSRMLLRFLTKEHPQQQKYKPDIYSKPIADQEAGPTDHIRPCHLDNHHYLNKDEKQEQRQNREEDVESLVQDEDDRGGSATANKNREGNHEHLGVRVTVLGDELQQRCREHTKLSLFLLHPFAPERLQRLLQPHYRCATTTVFLPSDDDDDDDGETEEENGHKDEGGVTSLVPSAWRRVKTPPPPPTPLPSSPPPLSLPTASASPTLLQYTVYPHQHRRRPRCRHVSAAERSRRDEQKQWYYTKIHGGEVQKEPAREPHISSPHDPSHLRDDGERHPEGWSPSHPMPRASPLASQMEVERNSLWQSAMREFHRDLVTATATTLNMEAFSSPVRCLPTPQSWRAGACPAHSTPLCMPNWYPSSPQNPCEAVQHNTTREDRKAPFGHVSCGRKRERGGGSNERDDLDVGEVKRTRRELVVVEAGQGEAGTKSALFARTRPTSVVGLVQRSILWQASSLTALCASLGQVRRAEAHVSAPHQHKSCHANSTWIPASSALWWLLLQGEPQQRGSSQVAITHHWPAWAPAMLQHFFRVGFLRERLLLFHSHFYRALDPPEGGALTDSASLTTTTLTAGTSGSRVVSAHRQPPHTGLAAMDQPFFCPAYVTEDRQVVMEEEEEKVLGEIAAAAAVRQSIWRGTSHAMADVNAAVNIQHSTTIPIFTSLAPTHFSDSFSVGEPSSSSSSSSSLLAEHTACTNSTKRSISHRMKPQTIACPLPDDDNAAMASSSSFGHDALAQELVQSTFGMFLLPASLSSVMAEEDASAYLSTRLRCFQQLERPSPEEKRRVLHQLSRYPSAVVGQPLHPLHHAKEEEGKADWKNMTGLPPSTATAVSLGGCGCGGDGVNGLQRDTPSTAFGGHPPPPPHDPYHSSPVHGLSTSGDPRVSCTGAALSGSSSVAVWWEEDALWCHAILRVSAAEVLRSFFDLHPQPNGEAQAQHPLRRPSRACHVFTSLHDGNEISQ